MHTLDLREKLDDLDKDDASKYGVEMAGVCSSRQSPSSAGQPDAAGLDAHLAENVVEAVS